MATAEVWEIEAEDGLGEFLLRGPGGRSVVVSLAELETLLGESCGSSVPCLAPRWQDEILDIAESLLVGFRR